MGVPPSPARAGGRPITTAPVVAQVSRTPRQASLHRLPATCRTVGFEPAGAQSVGALLANSLTSDVVDAHLVRVAERHDALVVTSDGDDIAHLAAHVGPQLRPRQL